MQYLIMDGHPISVYHATIKMNVKLVFIQKKEL